MVEVYCLSVLVVWKGEAVALEENQVLMKKCVTLLMNLICQRCNSGSQLSSDIC